MRSEEVEVDKDIRRKLARINMSGNSNTTVVSVTSSWTQMVSKG